MTLVSMNSLDAKRWKAGYIHASTVVKLLKRKTGDRRKNSMRQKDVEVEGEIVYEIVFIHLNM